MDIPDIDIVSGDSTVLNAFVRVVRSGHSAILVQSEGGTRLHFAETLHEQMRTNPNSLVRDVDTTGEAGGWDLVNMSAGLAHLRIASRELFDRANLVVKLHYCHGMPRHSYFDWDLQSLSRDATGNYICDYDPTIVT